MGSVDRVSLSPVPQAEMRRFHLKTETESGLQHAIFELEDSEMFSVQNCEYSRHITDQLPDYLLSNLHTDD
jgi:hypothetical protein